MPAPRSAWEWACHFHRGTPCQDSRHPLFHGRMDTDSETAATSHFHLESSSGCNFSGRYLICLRVGLIISIRSIRIDRGHIFLPRSQEIQMDFKFPGILVSDTTYKPTVTAILSRPDFGFPRYHYVITRLCHQISAFGPVNCHILYKLECILIFLIMFREICRHLKRRIQSHIKSKLIRNRRIDMRMIGRIKFRNIHYKYAWSIIHRPALKSGKRKQSHMERLRSTESLILCTTCRLIAYKVRICTAQSCRTYSFMCIDHYMVFCSFLHCIKIMVDHPLPIMMFTTWDYITYISALHRIVSVFRHQTVSCVQMTLIIPDRT